MRWKKRGWLYAPDGSKPWMRSHAANPVAEPIGGDRVRVYFSSRDDRNRSSIAFVDVDLAAGAVLAEADTAVLSPGDLAMFDDCGVSIGCILPRGGARYLYYMGWHLTVAVPWQNALGLAISDAPGQPFRRVSRFPIVPLDEVDPYTISYPWVIEEDGRFRMWYGSNLAWGTRKEDMRHVIKYAESRDGIHWDRSDVVAIGFDFATEYAICKPCVIRDGDVLKMWFCSRGETYRIRYAESRDGIHWERHAEPGGIDVSPEGWDAEMIEYPFVFDHSGSRHLLYSGNGFGRTGFGLATLEP